MPKKPNVSKNQRATPTTSAESRARKQRRDIAQSASDKRWMRAKKTKTTKKGW